MTEETEPEREYPSEAELKTVRDILLSLHWQFISLEDAESRIEEMINKNKK